MRTITVQIPDDLDRALNVQADELVPALLLAAAVQLFAMGRCLPGRRPSSRDSPHRSFWSNSRRVGFQRVP
jgi:hypothetical protein